LFNAFAAAFFALLITLACAEALSPGTPAGVILFLVFIVTPSASNLSTNCWYAGLESNCDLKES
jgi:hypothetical protein